MLLEVDILSLFPGYFAGPLTESMLKRAIEKKILGVNLLDIRKFAEGKHKKVDARPYGGGPGMVMMPGPCTAAIRSVKRASSKVVYLTPKGKQLDAKQCAELATHNHLILFCGHYEGVDERVMKEFDEQISIGPYVLTNGGLAALVLLDAVARFVPGVLGHPEAAYEDSFQNDRLESPLYTRPALFEGDEVPQVLREGNHREIAKWQQEHSRLVNR